MFKLVLIHLKKYMMLRYQTNFKGSHRVSDEEKGKPLTICIIMDTPYTVLQKHHLAHKASC